MNSTRLTLLFLVLVLTLTLTSPALGAISGGGQFGGGGCRPLTNYIVDNWWDLRSYIASNLNVARPNRKNFACVDPRLTQELAPRIVPGHVNALQCFRGRDAKICCDHDLQACVAYSGQ